MSGGYWKPTLGCNFKLNSLYDGVRDQIVNPDQNDIADHEKALKRRGNRIGSNYNVSFNPFVALGVSNIEQLNFFHKSLIQKARAVTVTERCLHAHAYTVDSIIFYYKSGIVIQEVHKIHDASSGQPSCFIATKLLYGFEAILVFAGVPDYHRGKAFKTIKKFGEAICDDAETKLPTDDDLFDYDDIFFYGIEQPKWSNAGSSSKPTFKNLYEFFLTLFDHDEKDHYPVEVFLTPLTSTSESPTLYAPSDNFTKEVYEFLLTLGQYKKKVDILVENNSELKKKYPIIRKNNEKMHNLCKEGISSLFKAFPVKSQENEDAILKSFPLKHWPNYGTTSFIKTPGLPQKDAELDYALDFFTKIHNCMMKNKRDFELLSFTCNEIKCQDNDLYIEFDCSNELRVSDSLLCFTFVIQLPVHPINSNCSKNQFRNADSTSDLTEMQQCFYVNLQMFLQKIRECSHSAVSSVHKHMYRILEAKESENYDTYSFEIVEQCANSSLRKYSIHPKEIASQWTTYTEFEKCLLGSCYSSNAEKKGEYSKIDTDTAPINGINRTIIVSNNVFDIFEMPEIHKVKIFRNLIKQHNKPTAEITSLEQCLYQYAIRPFVDSNMIFIRYVSFKSMKYIEHGLLECFKQANQEFNAQFVATKLLYGIEAIFVLFVKNPVSKEELNDLKLAFENEQSFAKLDLKLFEFEKFDYFGDELKSNEWDQCNPSIHQIIQFCQSFDNDSYQNLQPKLCCLSALNDSSNKFLIDANIYKNYLLFLINMKTFDCKLSSLISVTKEKCCVMECFPQLLEKVFDQLLKLFQDQCDIDSASLTSVDELQTIFNSYEASPFHHQVMHKWLDVATKKLDLLSSCIEACSILKRIQYSWNGTESNSFNKKINMKPETIGKLLVFEIHLFEVDSQIIQNMIMWKQLNKEHSKTVSDQIMYHKTVQPNFKEPDDKLFNENLKQFVEFAKNSERYSTDCSSYVVNLSFNSRTIFTTETEIDTYVYINGEHKSFKKNRKPRCFFDSKHVCLSKVTYDKIVIKPISSNRSSRFEISCKPCEEEIHEDAAIIDSKAKKVVYSKCDQKLRWDGELEKAITNLKSFTKYSIIIMEETDIGGNSIFVADIHTCSFPPQSVQTVSVDGNSVVVTWKKPVGITLDGILDYQVLWKQSLQTSWKKSELISDNINLMQTYTISDLDPHTSYQVKVEAITCQEDSYENSSSHEIVVKTLCPVPTSGGIEGCSSKNEFTILIKWKEARECKKFIDNYFIKYTVLDDNCENHYRLQQLIQNVQNDSGNHEAWINDLRPSTKYVFKLFVKMKDGNEYQIGESSKMTADPKTSRPGKPQIKVGNYFKELNLFWDIPTHNAQFLQSYTVNTYIKTDSRLSMISQPEKTIAGTEALCTISVNPGFTYLFTVQGLTTGGLSEESPFSDEIDMLHEFQPGQPRAIQQYYDRIEMAWAKAFNNDKFLHYVVWYKSLTQINSDVNWKIAVSKTENNSCMVRNLTPNTSYYFKIESVLENRNIENQWRESKPSEVINTKIAKPSPPGKPSCIDKQDQSVTISWQKPVDNYDNVQKYHVIYYPADEKAKILKHETVGREESVTIGALCSVSGYYFKVIAISEKYGNSTESQLSDCIKLERPVQHLILKCKKLDNINSTKSMYMLPFRKCFEDKKQKIRKFVFPSEEEEVKMGKKLLFVGPTGSGKSALINTIINHIFDVQWHDSFRLKLIDEEHKDQTKSVTKWITCYTIMKGKENTLEAPITIIDTPGIGDTEGVVRDNKIIDQLKFFLGECRISHLHGVVFVAKASDVRLTATHEYIIDRIFQIFGSNVKENVFVVPTFSDASYPQICSALRERKIIYKGWFSVNNITTISDDCDSLPSQFLHSYWDCNSQSLHRFFEALAKTNSVDLGLTLEVIEGREQIKIVCKHILDKIKVYLDKIDSIENLASRVKEKEENIKNFNSLQVEEKVMQKVKIQINQGEYTTNCVDCEISCHYPCQIPKDIDIYCCKAMDKRGFIVGAKCVICNCGWRTHKHEPFRYDYQPVQVSTDIRIRCNLESEEKLSLEKVLKTLNEEKEEIENDIKSNLFARFIKLSKRLDEIAFVKTNPITEIQYIDVILKREKDNCEEGSKGRIETLERLKHLLEVQTAILTGGSTDTEALSSILQSSSFTRK